MLEFFDYTKVFLKVTILNRSTKRAMTGPFDRAHFPWPFISKSEDFKQIPLSTNKVHLGNLLQVAVLNRSTKGAMTDSFCREYF